METDKELTVKEVAERMSVTIQTVRNWIKQNRLKATKHKKGLQHFYTVSELDLKVFTVEQNLFR